MLTLAKCSYLSRRIFPGTVSGGFGTELENCCHGMDNFDDAILSVLQGKSYFSVILVR